MLEEQDRTEQLRLVFPPMALCTDNGVMAAWAGIEKLRQGISNAIDGQEVLAKWNIGNLVSSRPGYDENNMPVRRRPGKSSQKPTRSSVDSNTTSVTATTNDIDSSTLAL